MMDIIALIMTPKAPSIATIVLFLGLVFAVGYALGMAVAECVYRAGGYKKMHGKRRR